MTIYNNEYVVGDVATGTGTSVVVPIPAAAEAGHFVVVTYAAHAGVPDGDLTTPTYPAGWTASEVGGWPNVGPDPDLGGAEALLGFAHRFLDGSEGPTVTITLSDAANWYGQAYLVKSPNASQVGSHSLSTGHGETVDTADFFPQVAEVDAPASLFIVWSHSTASQTLPSGMTSTATVSNGQLSLIAGLEIVDQGLTHNPGPIHAATPDAAIFGRVEIPFAAGAGYDLAQEMPILVRVNGHLTIDLDAEYGPIYGGLRVQMGDGKLLTLGRRMPTTGGGDSTHDFGYTVWQLDESNPTPDVLPVASQQLWAGSASQAYGTNLGTRYWVDTNLRRVVWVLTLPYTQLPDFPNGLRIGKLHWDVSGNVTVDANFIATTTGAGTATRTSDYMFSHLEDDWTTLTFLYMYETAGSLNVRGRYQVNSADINANTIGTWPAAQNPSNLIGVGGDPSTTTWLGGRRQRSGIAKQRIGGKLGTPTPVDAAITLSNGGISVAYPDPDPNGVQPTSAIAVEDQRRILAQNIIGPPWELITASNDDYQLTPVSENPVFHITKWNSDLYALQTGNSVYGTDRVEWIGGALIGEDYDQAIMEATWESGATEFTGIRLYRVRTEGIATDYMVRVRNDGLVRMSIGGSGSTSTHVWAVENEELLEDCVCGSQNWGSLESVTEPIFTLGGDGTRIVGVAEEHPITGADEIGVYAWDFPALTYIEKLGVVDSAYGWSGPAQAADGAVYNFDFVDFHTINLDRYIDGVQTTVATYVNSDYDTFKIRQPAVNPVDGSLWALAVWTDSGAGIGQRTVRQQVWRIDPSTGVRTVVVSDAESFWGEGLDVYFSASASAMATPDGAMWFPAMVGEDEVSGEAIDRVYRIYRFLPDLSYTVSADIAGMEYTDGSGVAEAHPTWRLPAPDAESIMYARKAYPADDAPLVGMRMGPDMVEVPHDCGLLVEGTPLVSADATGNLAYHWHGNYVFFFVNNRVDRIFCSKTGWHLGGASWKPWTGAPV